MKIGIMNGQDFKNVIAKKEFKSGDIAKISTLVFTANVDYSLHLFRENNKIPENISGKSIYPFLQQLKKSFDEAE
ncbi:MAG: hypothetical protein KJ630_03605 [Proteobacteria bacterium]|nr:hypothetical protein [Pseudomonadota bacterium]